MPRPGANYESCPYRDIPAEQQWVDAVAGRPQTTVNPHTSAPFRLTPHTRVGSAGSCFAQRISQALVEKQFNYLVTEPSPPWLTPQQRKDYNYGTYSARYGNIYTVLQLVQLVEQALGRFIPEEQFWPGEGGRFYDPLRPRIQPLGFSSERELRADRNGHLRAVKTLLQQVEVFVFTLGMTEGWRSRRDGTVFPVCPGCGAGEFDPARYEFHNDTVAEVIAQLHRFLDLLHEINPESRVLFTVSPVPLVATMTDRHVLQATVYSKSVLRAAVEEVVRSRSNTAYFASYEIATATGNNHTYFASDRRNVTAAGVGHIMRAFFESFVEGAEVPQPHKPRAEPAAAIQPQDVVCDEVALFEALGAQRVSGNGKG